jgi:hypothetical protein
MERMRLVLPLVGLFLVLAGIWGYATGSLDGVLKHFSKSGAQGSSTAVSAAASGNPDGTASGAGASDTKSADATAASAGGLHSIAMKQFSDQELLNLKSLPPQQQVEQMMMDAVNHYEGATDMVMQRVDGWRGQIKKSQNWDVVEQSARYSSDLRVRNAAIEVDLAINNLDKSDTTADQLMEELRTDVANRGWGFYMLGMLANRKVETSRIHSYLAEYAHDSDEGSRYWAIEGLAFIGTDDTIPDFLDVLHHDPSLNVRQRCGASLAKSGMLTHVQRMNAVPALIDIAADSSMDPQTIGWVYEALHEITGENLNNDATTWRNWFNAHGSEKTEQFLHFDQNVVLGNS